MTVVTICRREQVDKALHEEYWLQFVFDFCYLSN